MKDLGNGKGLFGYWLNLHLPRLYLVVVDGLSWPVVRDPSFSFSLTGGRLDVTVRVLLSRVAGVAVGSRSTLPLSEVALEHAAALPVSSLSGPPSARFFGVDGFPWTLDQPA